MKKPKQNERKFTKEYAEVENEFTILHLIVADHSREWASQDMPIVLQTQLHRGVARLAACLLGRYDLSLH